MFRKQLVVYLLFWGTVAYAKHLIYPNGSETNLFRTFQSNKLRIPSSSNKFPLLLETQENQVRHKRSIVLIDDDFDKIPDVSVKQSWSEGNLDTDIDNTTATGTEKYEFTEEGSGFSTLDDSSTNNLIPSTLKLIDISTETLTTEEIFESTTETEQILEGSGDDLFSSTSTTTTDSATPAKDGSMLQYCLNVTCEDKELTILPGLSEKVPEDTSLIILCSTNNLTNDNLLRWYRNNESESLLLETSKTKNQLKLVLPQTKTQDSGIYMCVRLSSRSCCHRKLDITIYRKPSYKYHLLTVGLVAAVSLFTCLLLGMHRKYKEKQYKKELKSQIPLNEFLL